MQRRDFLQGVGMAALSGGLLSCARSPQSAYLSQTKIAFGSCADQKLPQPIWNAVAAQSPDAFVFLGDNVYADTENMTNMAVQYQELGSIPEFALFRSKFPVVATWDDHDYGYNDSGCEYPRKAESKQIMLDFWGEPKDSPRRRREGVYTSYFLGQAPRRLQLILLDLRWFKSSDELLGETQWRWLEQQLQMPADFRVIGSSIQFLSSEHAWEKWAVYPAERERMISLLEDMKLRDLVFISGDMHFGEISHQRLSHGFDLLDVTASGLNRAEYSGDVPNSRRVQYFDEDSLFGMITVDWHPDRARLTSEIFDSKGKARVSFSI